ncbi:hypothetical protein [Microvirga rosea]|uniref:hypothetical protein n=1 Tax=Microvirga rosea TaxID=2715425 RepID=UPI001D0B6E13|nr:hypothetical protein [Microvirga rosea]MCB8821269.1 hypothetical protein [Microvirga rosea]
MSLLPTIQFVSNHSHVREKALVELPPGSAHLEILTREFFGDNPYDGKRLFGLRATLPADDFEFCEALFTGAQISQLAAAITTFTSIVRAEYSATQRTLKNPFGAGWFGKFWNDAFVRYKAVKATVIQYTQVEFEFGVDNVRLDIRHNQKWDEVFLVLTFEYASFSSAIRILTTEQAERFVTLLQKQHN